MISNEIRIFKRESTNAQCQGSESLCSGCDKSKYVIKCGQLFTTPTLNEDILSCISTLIEYLVKVNRVHLFLILIRNLGLQF
jgi:hypothetical protein